MYWLVRRWNAGTFAASFAGMAYVFNGVMMSSLIWVTYVMALAWLPWIIGCIVEAWRQGGRWIILAAIASAMQVLAGMPEITVFTWILIGALWVNALIAGEIGFLFSTGRMSAVIMLAAGITMIQILPFFDLLIHSQRNSDTATGAWSMPVWGWANLIVPLFHCYQASQGTWFQHGQDAFQSYYLGAGVLALGLAGLWSSKIKYKVAIVGMIIFFWVMALGPNGLVYEWLRQICPIIGFSRFPIKLAILPAFLLPLMAALTIEHLSTRDPHSVRRRLATVSIAILCGMGILLWLAWRFPIPGDQCNVTAWNTLLRALLMFLLLAGVFLSFKQKRPAVRAALQLGVLAILPVDALTHNPGLTPTLPSASLAPGMWQASGQPPPPKLGVGRIMIHPNAENQMLRSHVASMGLDLAGKRLAEWYNFNLLDAIPKINGPEPLQPAYFGVLEKYLYYTEGSRCGRGLVNFLSVMWLSSPDNPTEWIAQTNSLPLITAGQCPVFVSDKAALAGMTADDFDPLGTVFLSESESTEVIVTNKTSCTVTHARFTLNTVEADVAAAAPSLVVLSQTYYHLWQASVDGKPIPLLRANLAFQAVQVPTGTHHLRLSYRDPYLKVGSIISILSLLACVFTWLRSPKIH